MENMKHRRVRVLVPIVGLAALVVGIFVVQARRASSSASRGDDAVTASGTVEMTEVAISPKIGGRVAALLVDEGDVVRRGQVLARLDEAELDARVAEAQAGLAAAEARLKDLQNGSRPEEIARARAALARARDAYAGTLSAASTASQSYTASTELKQQLDAAEAAHEAARAQRQQARARLDLLTAGARPEELAQARAALTGALARRGLVHKGPRDEEIDEGRAGLASAKAGLANAEASFKRADGLYREGAISRQQLDDLTAARDRARAGVDSATARLRALNAGARPEERDQADAEVRRLDAQVRMLEAGARKEELAQARAELQRAQVNERGTEAAEANARRLYADRFQARGLRDAADTQVRTASRQVEEARAQLALLEAGPTAEAIQVARSARDQMSAALEQARSKRADAAIVAPLDAVVAERVAEPGETANPGQALLTLTDPRDTWVKVYLPVSHLGRVRLGSPASVQADDLPGRRFRGRVTEVSQTPEFTPKNVQTKEQRTQLVYWVKIAIDNPQGDLKPGLTADAVIGSGEGSHGR